MISAYTKRDWVYMDCPKCKSQNTLTCCSLGTFNYSGMRCNDCKFEVDF